MEIKAPWIIIVSIIAFALVMFLALSRKGSKKNKKKVANTSIIKKSNIYKDIIKKYRMGLYGIYAVIFICVLTSSIMTSRVVKTRTEDNAVYNRDIILCMDISTSVNDLNKELVETYKEVVKSLNGERFGISIFNTSSYTLVPLTEDYDYITENLNTLSEALNNNTTDHHGEEYLYYNRYLLYGTLVGNNTRGSSLVGDGLASCIFDFPDLDEERSRIIVFSTDNDVQGKEYINVTDAAKLAKKKGIVVYSVAPKETAINFGTTLKEATESTGGSYFVQGKGSTINEIVSGIESQEKSILEGGKKTISTDHPEVAFVFLILGFAGLIVVDKVVLS